MPSRPSLIEYLEAGLKAASMRQGAIANNLANLRTPNYRRWDVKFEQLLGDEMARGHAPELDEARPRLVCPRDTPVGAHGNDVRMEHEIGEMIKNAGRYKTYIRLVSKVYEQMHEAMRTGQ